MTQGAPSAQGDAGTYGDVGGLIPIIFWQVGLNPIPHKGTMVVFSIFFHFWTSVMSKQPLSGYVGHLLLKNRGVCKKESFRNLAEKIPYFLEDSVSRYIFELFACKTNLEKNRSVQGMGADYAHHIRFSPPIFSTFRRPCCSIFGIFLLFIIYWDFSVLVLNGLLQYYSDFILYSKL